MLHKAGAEVSVAGNGRLAIENVREAQACGSPFDIILMDMQMPEMGRLCRFGVASSGGREGADHRPDGSRHVR